MKYHYVYRITNIIKNKHYYGIRTTKNNPLKDLGIKYFSSSKDANFIQDQKLNQQDYKYKIVRMCSTRKQALELEIILHNKFDVGINESFYNKAKQTAYGFDRTGIHYRHSIETKEKIGKAHRGKTVSSSTRMKLSQIHKDKVITPQHRESISNKLKGKKNTGVHNEKISKSLKNKPKSENHKKNMSVAWKNRPFVKCPYCDKESQNTGVMNRWHFDNCKLSSKFH